MAKKILWVARTY